MVLTYFNALHSQKRSGANYRNRFTLFENTKVANFTNFSKAEFAKDLFQLCIFVKFRTSILVGNSMGQKIK